MTLEAEENNDASVKILRNTGIDNRIVSLTFITETKEFTNSQRFNVFISYLIVIQKFHLLLC